VWVLRSRKGIYLKGCSYCQVLIINIFTSQHTCKPTLSIHFRDHDRSSLRPFLLHRHAMGHRLVLPPPLDFNFIRTRKMGHVPSLPERIDHRRNRLDRKRASKGMRTEAGTGAGRRAVITTGALGVAIFVLVAVVYLKTSLKK
jgi:hypothetical protein